MFIDIGRGLVAGLPALALPPAILDAVERGAWIVFNLSGGKDSCYNAMLCERYGHELVCLANLAPASAEVQELDSFMYQTAAHTAIEVQAQCFGLPSTISYLAIVSLVPVFLSVHVLHA